MGEDLGIEPDYGWPPPAESIFEFQKGTTSFEQFDGNILTTISEEGYLLTTSGGAAGSVMSPAVPDKADGGAQLVWPSSPAAPSGASLQQNPFTFQANAIDGILRHVVRVYIDVLPELGTQTMLLYHGIAAEASGQIEPDDGYYFYFDQTLSNWAIKQARGGVRKVQDTFFSPVAGAWQTLGLEVDIRRGTVQAFAANDGALLKPVGRAVLPVNIQPATDLTSLLGGAGTGSVETLTNEFCDYIGWQHVYGSPR
jgi:hypothetical protein